MIPVAVKISILPMLIKLFKTLVSPDSPVDLQVLLEVFNRNINFFLDPDFLESYEDYIDQYDFYQEPIVEVMFYELLNSVEQQMETLGGKRVVVTSIRVINVDTVIVDYELEVNYNVSNTLRTPNRFDCIVRNLCPTDHRGGNPKRGRFVSPRRRQRPYARR